MLYEWIMHGIWSPFIRHILKQGQVHYVGSFAGNPFRSGNEVVTCVSVALDLFLFFFFFLFLTSHLSPPSTWRCDLKHLWFISLASSPPSRPLLHLLLLLCYMYGGYVATADMSVAVYTDIITVEKRTHAHTHTHTPTHTHTHTHTHTCVCITNKCPQKE